MFDGNRGIVRRQHPRSALAATLSVVAVLALLWWPSNRSAGQAPKSRSEKGANAKDGAEELQGKWDLWREETANGTGAPNPGTTFMVIEGDKVTWLWGRNNVGQTATYKVSADVDPKEIDVTITSADARGRKQLGIYRMTKDGQLQICLSGIDDAPKRPRKFTAKITPGSGWVYRTYRKEDYKDPPEVAKEMKKLQGRWGVRKDPGSPVMIEDDVMTFYWGGNQVGRRGRFTIDPSKDPKQIELVYTQGYPGQKVIGMYRLKGDTLELVFGGFDSDKRPTKFADKKSPGGGDQYYKLELQEK
jgi:uncharacterized protein (TIGR03067 family)